MIGKLQSQATWDVTRNRSEAEVKQYRVGVLGATGTVGQQIVHRLERHPWFRVTAVAASDQSAGKTYAEAARWRVAAAIPAEIRDLVVRQPKPDLPCDFVLSALDAGVAGEIELAFAQAGYAVLSNTRNHRMEEDVPLLVPEVNPGHVELVRAQQRNRGYDTGFIATNPNCSTAGLVLPLKAIHDAFGVDAVSVVTLQAISGAGYPGVASLDIADNVIPFISGEEEKMESEPRKILGTLAGGRIEFAPMKISAQCTRVPVIDGHMEAVSVKLRRPATPAAVSEALRSFTAEPQRLGLPSAPARPIEVREEKNRPQTRLDRDAGNGMAVVVGRVRACPILDIRFVLLSHNLVRGAAGAAILNAELFAAKGLLASRTTQATTAM